jgi:hypothetical protein
VPPLRGGELFTHAGEVACLDCTSFTTAGVDPGRLADEDPEPAPEPVYRSLDGRRWKAAAITAYGDLETGDPFVLVGEVSVAVRGQWETPYIWQLLCKGPITNLAVIRLRPAEDDVIDLGDEPLPF